MTEEKGFWDRPADTGCREAKLTQCCESASVCETPCYISATAASLKLVHTEKLAFCFLSWDQVIQYFSAGKGNQFDLVLNASLYRSLTGAFWTKNFPSLTSHKADWPAMRQQTGWKFYKQRLLKRMVCASYLGAFGWWNVSLLPTSIHLL